jgi:hypothetical protein
MGLDHPGQQATTTMPHDSDSILTAGNPSSSNSNPRTVPSTTSHPPIDLSDAIKGMYRILDLISEQGSGGLGKLFCSLQRADPHLFVSRQNYYLAGLLASVHQ